MYGSVGEYLGLYGSVGTGECIVVQGSEGVIRECKVSSVEECG